VTNASYTEFLNRVDAAGTDLFDLYNPFMELNSRGGIEFDDSASSGLKYSVKLGRDSNPVVYVTWYSAIRFVNWLHNGQGSSDTESGAYTLLGGTPVPSNGTSITRDSGARWFLPSEDEWYKAAYHNNDGPTANYWDYPTATDTDAYSDQPPGGGAPNPSNTANFLKDDQLANGYDDGFAVTGSPNFGFANYLSDVGAYESSQSPYGTYDQGGNAWEWTDVLIVPEGRVLRGGSWLEGDVSMSSRVVVMASDDAGGNVGFRVATAIPEPSSLCLIGSELLLVLFAGWRRPRTSGSLHRHPSY